MDTPNAAMQGDEHARCRYWYERLRNALLRDEQILADLGGGLGLDTGADDAALLERARHLQSLHGAASAPQDRRESGGRSTTQGDTMAQIKIATNAKSGGKPQDVPALTFGVWAAHQNLPPFTSWAVTHVPSGRALPTCALLEAEAVTVATQLGADFADFGADCEFGGVPAGWADRKVAIMAIVEAAIEDSYGDKA